MKRSRWRCCASESVAWEDNETSIGTCLNPCSCRSDLLGRYQGREDSVIVANSVLAASRLLTPTITGSPSRLRGDLALRSV
jgi:hypothetical protein